MPKVTFRDAVGDVVELNARSGLTLMEVAVHNSIKGIAAECGGGCSCATCHVFVDDAWYGRTGTASDYEEELLQSLDNRRPHSRLACQVNLTDALDGVTVTVAEAAS